MAVGNLREIDWSRKILADDKSSPAKIAMMFIYFTVYPRPSRQALIAL